MPSNKIPEQQLDKRVAHRYVSEGLLESSEWDKHLAGLPDVGERSDVIAAQFDTRQSAPGSSLPDSAGGDSWHDDDEV